MGEVITGLPDDVLRDRVAEATARYFLDWAHPVSGMARERSGGAFGYDIGETVTSGGSGFGIMVHVVAAERGWRPRGAILEWLERLVGWLERCERFHGVWPHFLNGTSGRAQPFMPGDDAGDIVETAFLAIGLMAAAEYFTDAPALVTRIDALLDEIDWSAHLQGEKVMWHRPKTGAWAANALPLGGWNEAFPVFVLGAGAARAEHRIPAAAYHGYWASTPAFRNGRSYHGIPLPLGPDWGGPLFMDQYPFLGIDPTGLADAYADYGVQARAHALVNRAHCIANPGGHPGYGPDCWGLTASDDPAGYAAHNPLEDTGVITPTAALGSFPFTPEESMAALRYFHDVEGPRIWGEWGFADAFVPVAGWVAQSRLAIDQGPIVIALENYRSGLLWRLVMRRPEIRRGLAALGFSSPHLA